MNKSINFKLTVIFIIIEAALCFGLGSIYTAVQQNIRLSADDIPSELALKAASDLSSGKNIQDILPADQVNLDTSLSPFAIIVNDQGEVISGNARLDDKTPVPPKGVFDYTRSHGEDKITWQPKSGVRQAIVVEKFSNNASSGFVVAGHSLKEYENHIASIGTLIQFLLLLGTIGNMIGAICLFKFKFFSPN